MNLSFDFGLVQQAGQVAASFRRPAVDTYSVDNEPCPATPRGPAYRMCNYHNGIVEYDTHRKSCTSITPELAKKIPKALRKKWYFELDGAFIPLYYLYEEYRLVAEQVAAVEGADQLGRYGSLSFVYSHSKDDVMAHMLRCPVSAAVYDFESGIVRNVEQHFTSDYDGEVNVLDVQLYLEKMAELKNPGMKSLSSLVTGVRVRFDRALHFAYEGQQVSVKEFTVKREGRAIRFLPDGYPFVARVSNLQGRKFEIIS